MAMRNKEIASIFNEIADLLEISGENAFRINSYRNAARAIEDLSEDIAALQAAGKLSQIRGIGDRTEKKIEEYLQTGKISAREDLLKKVPHGLVTLLKIPGMGPKTVATAWKQLGVEDLEGLVKSLRTGHFEKLPGMGPKKIENIKKGLDFITGSVGRKLLGIVLPIAEEIQESLRKLEGCKESRNRRFLRRRAETHRR